MLVDREIASVGGCLLDYSRRDRYRTFLGGLLRAEDMVNSSPHKFAPLHAGGSHISDAHTRSCFRVYELGGGRKAARHGA